MESKYHMYAAAQRHEEEEPAEEPLTPEEEAALDILLSFHPPTPAQ